LLLAGLVTALTLVSACGGGGGTSGGGEATTAPATTAPASTTPATTEAATTAAAEGTPQSGGDLIIARVADSQSMDKTTVFDNESIWIFQQMFECLFAVTPDGKDVQPWLAESYDLSPDQLTWTFHLRHGVKFTNGQEMTSADVKFSIQEAMAVKGGWEWIDGAIKTIDTPDPYTVVITTKYKWSPLLADLALFSNGIIPNNYAGQKKDDFYQHPIGTGPFMWDHWTKGQELKLVKNPNYWQQGKPYLDSVTWTTVGDDNTRILQLKGGQIGVNEFPPFSAIDSLKSTPGVTMTLFPSTRTDYLIMNHNYKPLADVHVRRAISMAIDREALIKSILFGNGQPANSFMPPQVPYYDPNSPGLQFNLDQAKQEMAQSGFANGFDLEYLESAGDVVDEAIAQIVQQALQPLGIKVTIKKEDPTTAFEDQQKLQYQISHSYWTMDIADPDELVTFAVDPSGGAHSFFTDYNNPAVAKLSKQAESTFDTDERQNLYNQIQTQAANDAFMVFLYYSPYRYAYSDKLQGFVVYPTGNYHLEDAWLKQ
jgi:peptide/nickel transport system substrate-binding protein